MKLWTSLLLIRHLILSGIGVERQDSMLTIGNGATPKGCPTNGNGMKFIQNGWKKSRITIVPSTMQSMLAKQCQGEDTAAFLCFISVRLLEMHRILKPTGSIYLHCDPTASHYIKMCMDAIFGNNNFRNEIVWHYSAGNAPKKFFKKKHDIIFYYSKGGKPKFNQPRETYHSKDQA